MGVQLAATAATAAHQPPPPQRQGDASRMEAAIAQRAAAAAQEGKRTDEGDAQADAVESSIGAVLSKVACGQQKGPSKHAAHSQNPVGSQKSEPRLLPHLSVVLMLMLMPASMRCASTAQQVQLYALPHQSSDRMPAAPAPAPPHSCPAPAVCSTAGCTAAPPTGRRGAQRQSLPCLHGKMAHQHRNKWWGTAQGSAGCCASTCVVPVIGGDKEQPEHTWGGLCQDV